MPPVRIAMSLADAQALSSVLLDPSPAVSDRLSDQLWLRTVLIEQRRRTPRAERAAFDAQADQILQQLDPDTSRVTLPGHAHDLVGEGIALEPRPAPRGGLTARRLPSVAPSPAEAFS